MSDLQREKIYRYFMQYSTHPDNPGKKQYQLCGVLSDWTDDDNDGYKQAVHKYEIKYYGRVLTEEPRLHE